MEFSLDNLLLDDAHYSAMPRRFVLIWCAIECRASWLELSRTAMFVFALKDLLLNFKKLNNHYIFFVELYILNLNTSMDFYNDNEQS